MNEGIKAGLAAAVISGAPSTLYSLAAGRDPLEATVAAGSMVLPNEDRRGRLIAAAVPVHLTISVFWGVVLAGTLPRKRPLVAGTIAGLAIGAFDLFVVGRRFPRIKALPTAPQLADHVAFGVVVACVLPRSR